MPGSHGTGPCEPRSYGDVTGLLLSSSQRGYKRSEDGAERPLLGRLALHAHRLRFPDPGGPPGAEVEVEAPLPKDFTVALGNLRRYAAARGGG